MNIFRAQLFSVLLLSVLSASRLSAAEAVVSPDGTLEARVELRDGQPFLSLARRGAAVLEPAPLGVTLKPAFAGGFDLAGQTRDSVDSAWTPVWGERSSIPDRYRSLTLALKERGPLARPFTLELRAYNEGLALRYRPAGADGADWQLEREDTAFRFPDGSAAFAIAWTEDTFPQDPVPITALAKNAMMPFTVRLPGGAYASVLEAAVVSYPRAMLAKRDADTVGIALQGRAEGSAGAATPWRVVLVGDSEARLIEHAHLVQTLNPPCALADTAWIRPGLTISDHGNCLLQMADLKRVIDVAHTNGFRYLQLDWGWYGTEWTWTDADRKKFLEVNPSWAGDLSWVTNTYADPYTVAKGRVPYRPDWKSHTVVDLDMPELVRYARERGMGLCLYVHGDVLRAHDLDKLFATYAAWGLAGLKPGFVRYGSAEQTDWIRSLAAAAARHKLWLCIHDAHVPDGMERTYPNLMTQEGIAGDETSPTNRLTLTILFTRMLAGAADNTICYYDPRVDKNATHAYQLAKAVCLYSPWQFLFWYDRPSPSPPKTGGAGGSLRTIGDEPELEFFAKVPTVWDETRVIHGRIGQYAVIARRHGRQWYVGAMNAGEERALPLPLLFLEPGCRYTVDIYTDDPSVATRTQVRIQRRPVEAKTVLEVTMSPQGGQAIRIAPTEEE